MVTFQEDQDAAIRLADLRVIEEVKSAIQNIVVYAHPALGRVLVLNGELQHVEAWRSHYHEPLVHLPASFVQRPDRVLILGGGCLFAAYEALKYSTVSSVEQVEYDASVVEVMLRHYPHARSVLTDRRFKLTIDDARTVLTKRERVYDLIICDCFDLSKERTRHRESAYLRLQGLLTPKGLCTDVMYRHVFNKRSTRMSLRKLAACGRVTLSLITVPEYPGVLHLQAIWGLNPLLSPRPRPIQNMDQVRHMKFKRSMKFEFYDPRYRAFYLYLPPYLRKHVFGNSGNKRLLEA